jgi:hypothetical protein
VVVPRVQGKLKYPGPPGTNCSADDVG